MAQTYYTDTYTLSGAGQTYLGYIETNFATLKSLFSGASAPGSPVPFQLFGDTTQKLLKYRDVGDSAWLGIFHGGLGQKVFVCRDSAPDGWAIDSGVTDKVCALKGGSTYTTGGATAGTWTAPSGLNHNHQWYNEHQTDSPVDEDTSYDEDGNDADLENVTRSKGYTMISQIGSATSMTDNYTATATLTGVTGWRPAAIVGTLQYMDLL